MSLSPSPHADSVAAAFPAPTLSAKREASLSAAAHDELVAQISHLPHLAAYALVSAAAGEALPLAGRGFVDTTRIAASAEALWADVRGAYRGSLDYP